MSLDFEALDGAARRERVLRLTGWFAMPLGLLGVAAATTAPVWVLMLGIPVAPQVVPSLVLAGVASGILLAGIAHWRRLVRADRVLRQVVQGSPDRLARTWLARAGAFALGMGLAIATAPREILGVWAVRALFLGILMSALFWVLLRVALPASSPAETHRRAYEGSMPWIAALAGIGSLMIPPPPDALLALGLAALITWRATWPQSRARQALELRDLEGARWWIARHPTLCGPILGAEVLRGASGSQEAETAALVALRTWTPIAAVPRLLVLLAEIAGERGDRDRAHELARAALALRPTLPEAWAAVAAADLHASRAAASTLEAVERARENATRSFPRQEDHRAPEYRALHAWALAATGDPIGAEEAWRGAQGDLVHATAHTRHRARGYLEATQALTSSELGPSAGSSTDDS